MHPEIEKLTSIVNPDDFTVKQNEIKEIKSFLENIKSGEEGPRMMLIKGKSGFGKTAFLQKCKEQADRERILTSSLKLSMDPIILKESFNLIKEAIGLVAPEWRGFISRRGRREESIENVRELPLSDSIQTDEREEIKNLMVKQFFGNGPNGKQAMEGIIAKFSEVDQYLIIIIDELEWFEVSGFDLAYEVLIDIVTELEEKQSNVAFIVSADTNALSQVFVNKLNIKSVDISMDTFPTTKADLLIRRRTAIIETERHKIVSNSIKSPFDLILKTQLNELGEDLEPNIESITKLFELEPYEVKALQFLANKDEFQYSRRAIIMNSSDSSLVALLEKRILVNEEGRIRFYSNALRNLFKRTFRTNHTLTVLDLLFKELEKRSDEGFYVKKETTDQMLDHLLKLHDDELIYSLTNKLITISNKYLEHEMHESSYMVLETALEVLQMSDFVERSGSIASEFGKNFSIKGEEILAAKCFELAGDIYGSIGLDWEARDAFREAGLRYNRLAEALSKSDSDGKKKKRRGRAVSSFYDTFGQLLPGDQGHFAARSFFEHAIRCYSQAEDRPKAEVICQSALKQFKDTHPGHFSFFKKIENEIRKE
ncbi:MAG: ATP-binding protein [Candidatus Kariarchaeaceae archaeon]